MFQVTYAFAAFLYRSANNTINTTSPAIIANLVTTVSNEKPLVTVSNEKPLVTVSDESILVDESDDGSPIAGYASLESHSHSDEQNDLINVIRNGGAKFENEELLVADPDRLFSLIESDSQFTDWLLSPAWGFERVVVKNRGIIMLAPGMKYPHRSSFCVDVEGRAYEGTSTDKCIGYEWTVNRAVAAWRLALAVQQIVADRHSEIAFTRALQTATSHDDIGLAVQNYLGARV